MTFQIVVKLAATDTTSKLVCRNALHYLAELEPGLPHNWQEMTHRGNS